MNDLIQIKETNGRETVDARELHAALEVGRDFSTWIKDREAEKKVENKPSESSSNIEAVDSYDDKGNGVKTELYKYREGKNAGMYGVRVIDTDADRVVPPIRIYADETKARAAYLEAAGIKNPTVAARSGAI